VGPRRRAALLVLVPVPVRPVMLVLPVVLLRCGGAELVTLKIQRRDRLWPARKMVCHNLFAEPMCERTLILRRTVASWSCMCQTTTLSQAATSAPLRLVCHPVLASLCIIGSKGLEANASDIKRRVGISWYRHFLVCTGDRLH